MSANIKVVRRSDIARCPKMSLLPDHYNADGTCRCGEREARLADVERAEDDMRAARDRLREARERLRGT